MITQKNWLDDRLPMRAKPDGSGFIVYLPDGEERHFDTLADAMNAAENGGELRDYAAEYVAFMSQFTLEERRAALARTMARKSARPRNPLTGHFIGGSRGEQ